MESKAKFLEEIQQYKNYDTELIGKAYDMAKKLHAGQLRKSGEPYIIHPMAVTVILAKLGMDNETLVAGLLHDVVEDTEYTREQMVEDFGEEVAFLVDGVTKLGKLKYNSKEEYQAENLRKMFLAMSKDIRVLIIKLADRLHNMRTIEYMPQNKIIEKSEETLEIYAPLADRLGIYMIKYELQDLCLKYLHPQIYEQLEAEVSKKREESERTIKSVIEKISAVLDQMDMHYDIMGRSKHIYSVYKKMVLQHKQLDQIFDLTAVRVIVDTVRDCYAVLGQVHTMWKPIPGRFKDYIAMPKQNMYQSLHTTVLGDNGEPFEIQIRTYEMHKIAEYGIAAHWKYKEGDTSGVQNDEDMKLSWLRQALEWQKDMSDPREFMETLKMDLFSKQVFVFTPKGKVVNLPAGSTPLDFAFKIHSEVGAKCVGAKVNGKMVPIDHELNNGDIVEIVTSSNSAGPSIDWLKIAKSSSARNKIRQYLKRQSKGDDVTRGKDALDRIIRKKGYDPKYVAKNSYVTRAAKEMKFASTDEAYIQIAQGGSLLSRFANLLFSYYEEDKQKDEKRQEEKERQMLESESHEQRPRKYDSKDPGIVIEGAEDDSGMMVRLSRCCSPVPGDEIIGFITKGRGISVHRQDCRNITSLPPEDRARLIKVRWKNFDTGSSYSTDICMECAERKGLLSDISKACEELDIGMERLNGKHTKDGLLLLNVTLRIENKEQMHKIMGTLRSISGVLRVYRV
jgi:GTP pyrophosphokinase